MSLNRRGFLKTTSGIAAGTTIGYTSVSSAQAKGSSDNLSAPENYPEISTRDHFDYSWWSGVTRVEPENSYEMYGDWNGIENAPEQIIWVHGWNTDEDGAKDGAYTTEIALQNENIDSFISVFSWDSDVGGGFDGGWSDGVDIAIQNGAKLAQYIKDQKDAGYEKPIRLICHSLGNRVVGEALNELAATGYENAVTSVSALGGAINNEDPEITELYGSSIESVVETYGNYHSENDSVLAWAYQTAEFSEAVGRVGIRDLNQKPQNYIENDVTDQIEDHFTYNDPEIGCMDEVVSDW